MQRLLHGLGTQVPGQRGKGAGLSPEYHRDCDIRGQQEKKKNKVAWIVWFGHDLEKLGNLEILVIFENFENFDVLR